MILLLLMATIISSPIAEALAFHDAKTPVGSVLRSAGWRKMPTNLAVAGQMSAGVESARLLNRVQSGVSDILSHRRDANGALTDRSGFIRDLMKIARAEGLAPADPRDRGTIKDVTSERRTELIYTMQTGQAYGYADYVSGQDPDALDAYPAQELVRIRSARAPRDWRARWMEAGGQFPGGRMVALKTDPIWEKISRFGTPWPPFDFGSGMGLEDVSREEAIGLGLITPTQTVAPSIPEFSERLQQSVRGLSPELKQNLQSLFGDQVEIDGDTVRWKGSVEAYERTARNHRETARSAFERSAGALQSIRLGDDGAEILEGVQRENARTNGAEIAAVAAGRKPVFHEDYGFYSSAELDRVVRSIQSSLPQGVVARHIAGHLYVYHPDLVGRFADTARPLLEQVIEHRDDGRWLGYGADWKPGAKTVRVGVFDAAGRMVSGFHAPADTAELYATARARDFSDATGQIHTWVIDDLGGGS